MRVRQATLLVLGCAWLLAAVAVTVATVSLVSESGWSDMPAFAWLCLAGLFGVALPGLLWANHQWVWRARHNA